MDSGLVQFRGRSTEQDFKRRFCTLMLLRPSGLAQSIARLKKAATSHRGQGWCCIRGAGGVKEHPN
jgi:hypothetical protein